jgi:NAD(P)-dependent dehydrogenase (short-subunit alcohol dehydrogenase family)
VLGLVGYRNSAAYVAAKHAVIGLTRAAALEYAPENIRVNAICPGFIDTPMLVQEGINEDEKAKAQIKSLHALDRLGKPEEIAKGFIFLASDDSSFVTGSALAIDGGYLAH